MKQRTVTKTVGARRVTKTPRLNPVRAAASDAAPDEYPGLVRSAAAGDDDALNRLLMQAQEVAWRFSTAVCGHGGDAEDAMQEALIKTYRHVGHIREPGAFRPWLYRTVRNACLMGRRKKVGEPARLQSLDELLPGYEGLARLDTPDPGKNPEQLADNAGLRARNAHLRTANTALRVTSTSTTADPTESDDVQDSTEVSRKVNQQGF